MCSFQLKCSSSRVVYSVKRPRLVNEHTKCQKTSIGQWTHQVYICYFQMIQLFDQHKNTQLNDRYFQKIQLFDQHKNTQLNDCFGNQIV